MSKVRFTRSALDQLKSAALQAADGLETGGLLMGAGGEMGEDFLVRHCGGPGPGAVRTAQSFRRDLAFAQAFAAGAFEADGSVWIGEWHTHGGNLDRPSPFDLATLSGLLEEPDLLFARILSVIVLAHPDDGWTRAGLHAWSFSGRVLRSLPLDLPEDGTGP